MLLLACLAGCATRTGTVVLLPERDGRGAAVVVKEGDSQAVLDKPYAAVELRTSGLRPYEASPKEVEERFGSALAAQPSRPARFTLYFVEGTDQLTPESQRIFAEVLADIARHSVPDVVVIGHTDTVGSDVYNDALARQRAESVRGALVRSGLAPSSIVAEGRGKREPVVPTADGVAEPRNRRVEIVVR